MTLDEKIQQQGERMKLATAARLVAALLKPEQGRRDYHRGESLRVFALPPDCEAALWRLLRHAEGKQT